MNENLPLVTIIVPAYNAEKTIENTLNSIVAQDYQNIELILINDCSVDNTLHIISEFIANNKDFNISVKSHEENLGVASARNFGLALATGFYIYFVDADDEIEPVAISKLVESAKKNDSDIVGCSWYLTFEKNKRKMFQPTCSNSLEALKAIFNGKMRWNLWLFMVKRSLYIDNGIRFIDGNDMGEDLLVMVKLFLIANKFSFIDDFLYSYNQTNEMSLTKSFSEIHIHQLSQNVIEVEKVIEKSEYGHGLNKYLSFLKLNIKLPLLISNRLENYEVWIDWFKESNSNIMDNKNQSLRIKILQWMAKNRQFWFVRLHYFLVVRFVYGVVYK